MATFSWEQVGAAVGSILIFIGTVFAAIRSHNRSDGKPPVNREPSHSEVVAQLKELLICAQRSKNHNEDAFDALERKLNGLERAIERLGDNVSSVGKAIDRVEAASRFEAAAHMWRQEMRGKRDE